MRSHYNNPSNEKAAEKNYYGKMKSINPYQRLNIRPSQLEKVCRQWQIVEVCLFGSVLRDDFNAKSDIDILVSFADDAKITFFDLDTIEEQLGNLFNRPVDVVTKGAIEQSRNWIRKKNILENSKVIYEQRSRNTSGSYRSL